MKLDRMSSLRVVQLNKIL